MKTMKKFVVVFVKHGCKIDTDIYPATSEEDAERIFEEDNKLNKWGYKLIGAIEYAED